MIQLLKQHINKHRLEQRSACLHFTKSEDFFPTFLENTGFLTRINNIVKLD